MHLPSMGNMDQLILSPQELLHALNARETPWCELGCRRQLAIISITSRGVYHAPEPRYRHDSGPVKVMMLRTSRSPDCISITPSTLGGVPGTARASRNRC